jgi:hypothetical protein
MHTICENGFTEGNQFLDVYLKNKDYIYVSCVTHEFFDVTYNWYTSLKKLNLQDNVVLIALNRLCYNKLLVYNIPCVLLETNISPENIDDAITIFKKANAVAYIGKKYKIDIIHSEVDIVITKSCIEKLKEETIDFDIAVASNRIIGTEEDHYIDTFGFAYFPFNEKTKPFWDFLSIDGEKAQSMIDSNSDFSLRAYLFECFQKNNIKLKILDLLEFPNGSILFTKDSPEEILQNCYILHYNNVLQEDVDFRFFNKDQIMNKTNIKVNLMKKYNHWFI